MDNLIELIKTRRSIRKFAGKLLTNKEINLLLEAAMYAPSARNLQPWHFIVVTERTLLDKIMQAHPYAAMLNEAPLAIVVCADENIEKSEGYQAQDCAAATQNILLAAHAMELGSVWLGVFPREERIIALKNLFHLPEKIYPFSIIAVGYPAEVKEQPERFKKDRIHTNQW